MKPRPPTDSLPLRTRVALVEAEQSHQQATIEEVKIGFRDLWALFGDLKTEVRVLRARVSIFAAIGAFAGGLLVKLLL